MDDVAIRVTDLSYAYSGAAPALMGISLSIDTGETVGLVGPNGAGKTTLFLILCGVLTAGPGRVLLAGLDPARPAERRRLPDVVGVVFQDSDDQLIHPTVEEDVAFGPLNRGLPPAEVRERVTEALARVGLQGAEQRVPYRMSGGEKRRAALAGVLALRPGILLLDEPTMFLDPRGRRDLTSLVRTLPGTKLIASHDLDFVLDTCARVLVIDGGRIVADGPPAEVLADAARMDRHSLEVPYRLR
jgi:cobalt/nickel transport system ATP-binding protein